MRIALFGGTFDPPHRGHLGAAILAAQAFHLDKVLFAPVGVQPLKEGRSTTPFAHRLAMVRLACAVDPRFEPSMIDSPRPGGAPNYTVDTLAALRQQFPSATLFCLVGADSFLSLPHWKEPHRLLALAEWIVISRPGSPLNDLTTLKLTPEELRRVHCIETMQDDVSATGLRRRLAAGEDTSGLLPPAVATYIRRHGLYRAASGSITEYPAEAAGER